MLAVQVIPDLSGTEPNVAIIIAVMSTVFALYTLYRQASSSRLGELDTVVGRISDENKRLLDRLADMESQIEEDEEKFAAMENKLNAISSDLEQCLASREADHAEVESLRERLDEM